MSAGLAGDRASAGNPAQIIRTVDDDRMILHRPASMPQKALVLGTPVWVPPMMWYCICSIMSRSCSSLLDPDTSVISSQPQPRDWLAGWCAGQAGMLLYSGSVCAKYGHIRVGARPSLRVEFPENKGGELAHSAPGFSAGPAGVGCSFAGCLRNSGGEARDLLTMPSRITGRDPA